MRPSMAGQAGRRRSPRGVRGQATSPAADARPQGGHLSPAPAICNQSKHVRVDLRRSRSPAEIYQMRRLVIHCVGGGTPRASRRQGTGGAIPRRELLCTGWGLERTEERMEGKGVGYIGE
jgi:hypothetical protein